MNSHDRLTWAKGIEPFFVVFVIVLNELMKQSLNHRVHCPVSLREPNRLTQQLNLGYSRQGKNTFRVPRKQGLGFCRLVGWLVFFFSERGIWCQLHEQFGWEFLWAIPMWLFASHQTYAPYTADFRPNIRDTQRCPVQQLCQQTAAFSIIFSI